MMLWFLAMWVAAVLWGVGIVLLYWIVVGGFLVLLLIDRHVQIGKIAATVLAIAGAAVFAWSVAAIHRWLATAL